MHKKLLFSIIAIAFVGGIFSTAYAGPILTTITFEGLTIFKENAQFDKDVNIDGTLTATNLAVGPHTVDTDTTFDGTDFALSGQSCPVGEKATGVDASGFVICAVDIDSDTDTNAGTICGTGEILDGGGNCIPTPTGDLPFFIKQVTLNDDASGNAAGWNPPFTLSFFSITDPDVTVESNVLATIVAIPEISPEGFVLPNSNVCNIFTRDGGLFLGSCSTNPNFIKEGSSLHYTIMRPLP